VSVYDRAKAANEIDGLSAYIPAPDRSLKGTSSWINYFLNRGLRPGTAQSFALLPGTKRAALVNLEPPAKTILAEKSNLVPLKTETGSKGR
jgi:hypothetical protein